MENDKISSLQSEDTALKKDIGLFSGINILAGIMIGSGIFYIGSYVLIRSGMSLGMSLLVWVIGGVVTLISGLCYAELGAMMPKAGGQYVYLREAFSERVAFVSGFSAFILGNTGSIAALSVAFALGLSSYFSLGEIGIKVVAILMVVLLTLINIRGIKLGALVQNISTIGKIIPIALLIVLGIFMGDASPNLSLVEGSQLEGLSIAAILSMVAYAVVATLWAYEGWTNLNVVSEELKNPKRNLPLALMIAIGLITLLYTIFHFSLYNVLTAEEISAAINSENYYLGTEVALKLLGNAGYLVTGIGMLLAIFGSLNGCVMAFPRTYYAMSRDGLFFKSYKEVHPKYKTPHKALIGSMIVAIILICFRNLDQITLLVIFSGMMFNAITFYSVIILRKKYPDMPRPYKVWGGKFTVILATLIMVALAINSFVEDPVNSLIGLVIPIVGCIIYQVKFGRK